jgi:ankyrin repeat protein
MQHGADVNAKAKSGNTPLLIASVGQGKLDAIRLLLDKGADVFAVNNKKENALIRAALFGDTATISFLLGKGIAVNAFSQDTVTALLNAVLNANRPVIIQLFRAWGRPRQGLFFLYITPLVGALIFCDTKSVKAILTKAKKDQ